MLFLLTSAISWTQTRVDTTYQVELTATACPMISFFRHPRVPQTTNNASLGYGILVRGMWHPGRLLSLGLMTGYLFIAQDEIPVDPVLGSQFAINPSARLAAIPLQAAISMQKNEIEIGMGVGPYLFLSTIDYGNGASAYGRRIEFGVTFFGSYFFSLNDKVKIGPELRVVYLGYRGILSWMPSLNFRFDTMRY